MVSPIPSASVLPSSRESRRPSSSLRAMISAEAAARMSWRCWIGLRAQAWEAATAASMACSVAAASACANWPTTSPVLDGLMLSLAFVPSTQSPAIRLRCSVMSSLSRFRRRSGRVLNRRGAYAGSELVQDLQHRGISFRHGRKRARSGDREKIINPIKNSYRRSRF